MVLLIHTEKLFHKTAAIISKLGEIVEQFVMKSVAKSSKNITPNGKILKLSQLSSGTIYRCLPPPL